MKRVRKYTRNRLQMSWDRDALYNSRVLYNCACPGRPRDRKKAVRHDTAKDEYRKAFDCRRKDFREDKCQYRHHHDRIQKRPKRSQRHIPVPDPKILKDKLLQQKAIITG